MLFDYEKITSTNAALALSAAKVLHPTYGGAQRVILIVESNPIRWTLGGTNPSTTGNGAPLGVDGVLTLDAPHEIEALRICSKTADTAGVVHVVYVYA